MRRPNNAFTRWTNQQAPIVGTWIASIIVGAIVGLLWLVATQNWRDGVLMTGLVTLATGLPLSFFVIKNGGSSAWRR
jgi:ABC-type uncharacterized transport system permease subunit